MRRARWRSCSPSRRKLQDAIDAANGWELDRTLEMAMDALRLPAGRRGRDEALGRREAPRGAVPHPAGEAGPAAARRAHQPPRRRERGVAGAAPQGVHGHGRLHHPRPVLPGQRGRSGFSSWTAARACPGRATTPAGWSRSRSGWSWRRRRRAARQKTLERELEWVRASPKARQAKSKARIAAYEELLKPDAGRSASATGEIDDPARAEAGRAGGGGQGRCARRYGDRLLIDDLNFKLPPGGIVGVIGPNGAGKTTLFRMITGQEKPDAGELRIGETVKLAYVDQSRDALDGDKSRVRGGQRAGWTTSTSGGRGRCRAARVPGGLRVQGRRTSRSG